MNRHATLDELAKLGADDLRPRKAARVNLHLAGCADCTQLNNQLSAVPALLSSIQFIGMPENLSARIDSAVAAEAANRVAAEPATEAGRRDLPVRSAAAGRRRPGFNRPHREHLAWRLPVPATRVLATAAAILIVGVGGYAIASHSGGAAPSSTSRSAAGLVTPLTSQAPTGPPVTYQQAGSARSIATVTSDTNFEASKLADQAAIAVSEARIDGVRSVAVKGDSVNSSLAAPSASAARGSGTLGAGASEPNNSQLTGCVDRVIGPGQVVLLVERAKFEGKPATIIVTEPASVSGTNPPKQAEIWAVGSACSETNSDVLDHVKVARL